ncbi:hypothetical protein HOLleu_39653 [Holothuria leucospilota]|uniref:Zinc finger protein 862-like n=1 Tax=Holothuria leucospilota TaxID=206669 RepID=A0A9Q0YNL8_HOLLE|nr:hypothetical protein HOLleu_39653 [Holothuria leucospilota]
MLQRKTKLHQREKQQQRESMMFTQYIVDDIREPLKDASNNARVFSVIYDGATDASVTEVEIVYCRYVRDGKPLNCFVNLHEVEHAHAEGVFSAIDNAMVSAGIENWKEKLVGAGSDGAKVNVGINNSVATRMQGDGREHIVIVHCVAHRLELAILGAIKENEMLQTVQDMLNKIHKHYHYSPKALRELEMVAEAMGEKFLKPQRLSGTRWVPHIRRALQVLISKYSVILAHFEHVSESRHGSTAEVQGRAKFLVKKLKDFQVVKFMMFMEDLLEIINILSLEFQKDDVTAVDVLDALDTATFSLVELGQRPGNTLQNFLDTVADSNGKYKGVLLMNYNDGTVAGHYQDIVDCTTDHISNRLSNSRDKARLVLEAARIFDVRDWPTTRTDLPPYGNQELDTLLQQFLPVLSHMGCDQSELKKEWIQLKAHVGNLLMRHRNRNQAPSLSTFFLTDDYRKKFHNILMLVEIVFVLPMSSAVLSIEGPELMEYDAEGALHRWWTAGKRIRRPAFEVAQRDDEGASEDEDELVEFILGQQE